MHSFPDPVENRLACSSCQSLLLHELDPKIEIHFSLENTGFRPSRKQARRAPLVRACCCTELDPEDRNSPALASFSLEICTGFQTVENRLGVLLLSNCCCWSSIRKIEIHQLTVFLWKYAQAFLILREKMAERPTVDEREFIKVERSFLR